MVRSKQTLTDLRVLGTLTESETVEGRRKEGKKKNSEWQKFTRIKLGLARVFFRSSVYLWLDETGFNVML